ncbi:MAG: peptidylprolyl isomerase [Bacteroidales bacterium]
MLKFLSINNNIAHCLLFVVLVTCSTYNAFGVILEKNVVDKVIAVIGNEAVLVSELEQEIMQVQAQGRTIDDEVRCQLFEQLLVQKLLLAQARVDSLKVNDMMVDQEIDQRIRYFTVQMGSLEEVEKYFGQSIFQIKENLKKMLQEKNLTQQMQSKIVENLYVTPRDVEDYYNITPVDSFPILPEQFIIQQIAKLPPSGSEARYDVRERLLELRERVINGEKFQTLAVLYSEDPGSAKRGGELGLSPREQFVKPFADAAWALKPGQVSQIVETEFGFHIIQMIEKKDDMANLRHILIRPKFSSDMQQKASRQLDSVAHLIRTDSISFERAVLLYSDDKKTRLNHGYVVNQQTQSTRFEKDQLMPSDYFVLKNMKVGDISRAFASKDNTGSDLYKIIKLKELIPSHRATLTQDYEIVQAIVKNDLQQKEFDQWIDKRIASSVFISISEEMQACTMTRQWVRK